MQKLPPRSLRPGGCLRHLLEDEWEKLGSFSLPAPRASSWQLTGCSIYFSEEHLKLMIWLTLHNSTYTWQQNRMHKEHKNTVSPQPGGSVDWSVTLYKKKKRLGVQSPVHVLTEGTWLMFLTLMLFSSLPFSLKSITIYSWVRIKKNKKIKNTISQNRK